MNRRKLLNRVLFVSVAVPLLGYGGVVAYFIHAEPRLVYFPTRQMRPVEMDLGMAEKVVFRSRDGTKLTARILRAARPGQPWIYFLHGNGGNVSTCQPWWRVIHRADRNLFVLDYRGFGESEGTPSEEGIYDDADAGYRFLRERVGAPASRIFVYGHSLGAAIAIDLATREALAGLIVEGALISIPARGQEMYPFLPVSLIAVNRYDSLQRISRVACPKLFMHARADHVAPISHGRRLYEAAPGPKEFLELDAGHNDSIRVDADRITATLLEFTKSVEK